MFDHVIKQVSDKEIIYGFGFIDQGETTRTNKIFQVNLFDKIHTCIETHLDFSSILNPFAK